MKVKFTVDKSRESNNSTFPAGDYYLTCIDVQDADKNGDMLRSKNGDQMGCLELVVSEGEYEGRHLWHYIVFLSPESKGYGIALHALHAFGLPYEDGDMEFDMQDFKDRTVKAKVGIQPAQVVGGKSYPEKNVIKDFYVMEPESNGKPTETEPQVPASVKAAFPKATVVTPARKLPWARK